MAVKPIPDGYHSVTPYLIVTGATRAIDFYKKAFGATEIMRFPGPNNTVMLADEQGTPAGAEYRSPQSVGGSPVSLMIYVPEVDKTFKQAISLGAQSKRDVQNQFYGDRVGNLVDPFGHIWTISTHVEDVSAEEMKKRMAALPKSA